MNELFLDSWQSILLILLSIYIMASGRIGLALGIYTAMPSWMTVVRFGQLNHLYVYLATMFGAAIIYRIMHPMGPWLPRKDRWIITWSGIWIGWMLFMLTNNQGNPSINESVIQSILLYILIPLPAFMLIAMDRNALRDCALSYVVTMSLGGIAALTRLTVAAGTSVATMVNDPFLSSVADGGVQWVARSMGLANWHWFAYGCGNALLLLLTLWSLVNLKAIKYVCGIGSLFFVYLIFLTGSRQATLGVVIVLVIFSLWLQPRIRFKGKLAIAVVIVLAPIMVSAIMAMRPELLIRDYDTLLSAFNPFQDRALQWLNGWVAFQDSPLWGDWFTGSPSLGHNYFISTLANQGLIGMIFLIGFIVFFFKQIRGIRNWSPRLEEDVWRMSFLCIGLFSFLVAQVSGSPVSNWPIVWAAVVLWQYQASYGPAKSKVGVKRKPRRQ